MRRGKKDCDQPFLFQENEEIDKAKDRKIQKIHTHCNSLLFTTFSLLISTFNFTSLFLSSHFLLLRRRWNIPSPKRNERVNLEKKTPKQRNKNCQIRKLSFSLLFSHLHSHTHESNIFKQVREDPNSRSSHHNGDTPENQPNDCDSKEQTD